MLESERESRAEVPTTHASMALRLGKTEVSFLVDRHWDPFGPLEV